MSVQVKGSGTIGGLDEGLVVSGIVTSSTQVNVGSNIKIGNAGVITATSFVGSGANLTGISTFSEDVKFTGATSGRDLQWDKSDNALEFLDYTSAYFGTDNNLQIYHNAGNNNTYISENGVGSLLIQASDLYLNNSAGQNYITCATGGRVQLNFAGSNKLETTNTGAIVTGICTATSFSGSGEGLTRTTQYSHRNKVINGAMNICQRATTQNTISSSGYYVADRFTINMVNVGSFRTNLFQSSQSPDGFNNSLGVSIGTGTAGAIAASERVSLEQRIEAQDLQDLSFGTSAAKSFTLSFYVRSSRTGQYGINMRQHDSGKDYNEKFDISVANTWERKIITVSGNTGDTFADDNGIGLWFRIMLRAGSNSVGNVNYQSWGSSDADKAPSGQQTTWGTDANDDFYLTGVQLEVGSVATPFEHRSYADEFRRCARYCYQWIDDQQLGFGQVYSGSGYVKMFPPIPVNMRAKPSVTKNAPTGYWFVSYQGNSGYAGDRAVTVEGNSGDNSHQSSNTFRLFVNGGSNQGNGTTVWCLMHDTTGAYLRLEAEL